MIEKILVLLKKGLKFEEDLIENIKKLSSNRSIKVVDFDDFKKEDLAEIDLVLTIGGDGTFVKAANNVENCLILGINANPDKSEGALTSINIEDIEKLEELFKGNFEVIKRYRAKVTLNGIVLDSKAINEVYLGAASQFHSSRYIIKHNGNEEEHRSSGVIVSTGTGSPAWFYSAGGKIFAYDEEKLSFIVREPYYGKRIFTPKILKGELKKGEKITIESKRDFGGILAINDETHSFNEGDVAEIELYDNPLKVVVLK